MLAFHINKDLLYEEKIYSLGKATGSEQEIAKGSSFEETVNNLFLSGYSEEIYKS